jgi:hypothetical protein
MVIVWLMVSRMFVTEIRGLCSRSEILKGSFMAWYSKACIDLSLPPGSTDLTGGNWRCRKDKR